MPHIARPESSASASAIDIRRFTAALGCIDETIAITLTRHPSIEDIVTRTLPWIPTVNFCDPLLTSEHGNHFVRVLERDDANEHNKSEGLGGEQ